MSKKTLDNRLYLSAIIDLFKFFFLILLFNHRLSHWKTHKIRWIVMIKNYMISI